MVDMAHPAGLIAAGLYPSPVPHAHITTSTTHKTLRGPRGGMILCVEELAKQIDKLIFPGIQGGPMMHIIAAKAVAFKEAASPEFKVYAQQVIDNARQMVKTMLDKGFKIVSGGTDSHLFLLDLTDKGITGKEAEEALDACSITVNKNTVPFETRSPFVTSGIRIGTAALTTRGMKTDAMEQIAGMIARVLENIGDEAVYVSVRDEVAAIAKKYPLYPELG